MKSAVLLVDLQNDFLAAPNLQPAAEFLIERATALLRASRDHGLPVIHIWTTVSRANDQRLPHWRTSHRWLCELGTPGHATPVSLQPQPEEIVIHKTGFNPFSDGKLAAALQQLQCDSVIIAGLHLHACVRTTATECLERQLQIHVAEDAVASNDPMHAAATRRWLAERSVRFESVNTILSGSDVASPALVHRSPRISREILFAVPRASQTEINAAVAAANEIVPAWQRISAVQRCETLLRFAEKLQHATPALARQLALEIGKPIRHATEEIRRAGLNVSDVIQRIVEATPKRDGSGLIRYEPLGVVTIISPWNNPVAIPVGKIAPALAYGNTVVWKPAPAAWRISEFLLRCFREAGVLDDALQLVPGDHFTAQALAMNPGVQGVTFTGSATGGYALQEICGRNFVPLQAELSGNNAAIVWDDADFSEAARQIASGAFGFAGQRCTANRRVIVSATRFEELVRELETAAGEMRWGDPLEDATEIGPVIHTAKRDEIAFAIARATTSGAAHRVLRVHETTAKEPWIEAGAYAQPVILGCDEAKHPLVQEETMGPVLIVQRAEDFDHALALCNGVRHGLAAALFSHSPELQQKFLDEARAGILKLNRSTAGADVRLPFGGWKASGIGPPEHGEADRLFYTRMQTVYGTSRDGE